MRAAVFVLSCQARVISPRSREIITGTVTVRKGQFLEINTVLDIEYHDNMTVFLQVALHTPLNHNSINVDARCVT